MQTNNLTDEAAEHLRNWRGQHPPEPQPAQYAPPPDDYDDEFYETPTDNDITVIAYGAILLIAGIAGVVWIVWKAMGGK